MVKSEWEWKCEERYYRQKESKHKGLNGGGRDRSSSIFEKHIFLKSCCDIKMAAMSCYSIFSLMVESLNFILKSRISHWRDLNMV